MVMMTVCLVLFAVEFGLWLAAAPREVLPPLSRRRFVRKGVWLRGCEVRGGEVRCSKDLADYFSNAFRLLPPPTRPFFGGSICNSSSGWISAPSSRCFHTCWRWLPAAPRLSSRPNRATGSGLLSFALPCLCVRRSLSAFQRLSIVVVECIAYPPLLPSFSSHVRIPCSR